MDKFLCHIVQTLNAQGSAPEWIELIPSARFTGADGRGPFLADDMQAIINASGGRKLPIDENHSTDLQGALGKSSFARGWIVEMQARDGGLWGRVEWTAEGRKLVEDRAYGFISPVLMVSKSKPHIVTEIRRAALTNSPNILSLKSLHRRETSMDKDLLKLLGLEEDADDAAVLAATKSLHARVAESGSAMTAIRTALEVDESAGADDVVKAINARSVKTVDKDDPSEVAALQDQVKTLNTQLTTLTTDTAKAKAVTVIDAAIEGGKLVPALRDHFIIRHMKAPDEVETELKVMPSLHAGGLSDRKIDDTTTISGADDQVCQMMGLDPKEFAKTAKTMKELH